MRGSIASHRKTDLLGAAESGAQFIQLQMREPEDAESALVQRLSVFASAGQPGADGRLPVAEDSCKRQEDSGSSLKKVSLLAWTAV